MIGQQISVPLTPSVPSPNTPTTQVVRLQGTIETTQSVRHHTVDADVAALEVPDVFTTVHKYEPLPSHSAPSPLPAPVRLGCQTICNAGRWLP